MLLIKAAIFIALQILMVKNLSAARNSTLAGLFHNGTCPNITNIYNQPEGPVSILEGSWFLQYSNPSFIDQDKKCTLINITLEGDVWYFTRYDLSIR
jgi:hypothetical protein